ncbi:MAG: laminin G [Alphaproteobacteria bacterium]|nr:MAG: laminin G [Alphaproteobacteria bacterium]PZO41593.1 MAG: laminin G [Alphaproteobacteria bacterium]
MQTAKNEFDEVNILSEIDNISAARPAAVVRRDLLKAASGAGLVLSTPACTTLPRLASDLQTVWRFDQLDQIRASVTVEGSPTPTNAPVAGALQFDGVEDALFIADHPLAGARTFAFEAIFRPDGRRFEQRWLHLQSDEVTVEGQPSIGTRFLFEIRVYGNEWALDTFIKGPSYSQALLFPDKLHPLGRWHHVAQTYDGTTYRSFVDGALQGEAPVAFTPQGPGRASVGTRINRRDYFEGAIAEARFTKAFLAPDQFNRKITG